MVEDVQAALNLSLLPYFKVEVGSNRRECCFTFDIEASRSRTSERTYSSIR